MQWVGQIRNKQLLSWNEGLCKTNSAPQMPWNCVDARELDLKLPSQVSAEYYCNIVWSTPTGETNPASTVQSLVQLIYYKIVSSRHVTIFLTRHSARRVCHTDCYIVAASQCWTYQIFKRIHLYPTWTLTFLITIHVHAKSFHSSLTDMSSRQTGSYSSPLPSPTGAKWVWLVYRPIWSCKALRKLHRSTCTDV